MGIQTCFVALLGTCGRAHQRSFSLPKCNLVRILLLCCAYCCAAHTAGPPQHNKRIAVGFSCWSFVGSIVLPVCADFEDRFEVEFAA